MIRFFRFVLELGRTVMAKDPAARSLLVSVLFSPGVKAQAYHWIAHALYKRNFYRLSMWLSFRNRRITGIEIHPAATLGRRILMDHGMGIVIGETAIVGDDVTLFHSVTLGGTTNNRDAKRHPTVGDGVTIGTGTTVLGDVTIGDYAKIGANSVVLKDIPAHTTAVGTPAVVVRVHEKE